MLWVKDKYLPLTAFTYGELEDESYSALTACAYCNPALRAEEIEAINERYAGTSGKNTRNREKE